MYARSNWIDNPEFEYSKLSRSQSMEKIRKTTSIYELVLLMNPDRDKMYGWNFLYLLNNRRGTIEFRRGPASTSATQVFMWIELAMAFIKASVSSGTWENLSHVPRNLNGLRWFLMKYNLVQVPGLHDLRYLDALFQGRDMGTCPNPIPLGQLSQKKKEKLMRKKAEDKQKNITEAKILSSPYWG